MSQQPWGPQQDPYQQQPYGYYGPPPQPAPPQPGPIANGCGALVGIAVFAVVMTFLFLLFFRDRDNGGGTRSVEVSRSSYERSGRDWPLTVDQATLKCKRLPNTAYFMTVTSPGGATYALNPWAEREHPRIDPIWRKDSRGSNVSLGDLSTEAMGICPER